MFHAGFQHTDKGDGGVSCRTVWDLHIMPDTMAKPRESMPIQIWKFSVNDECISLFNFKEKITFQN